MKIIPILLLSGMVFAQSSAPTTPRPFIEGSFNLMPGGYYPIAFGFGGGVMWDTNHFIFDSLAAYDNGRKTNDATVNNIKGHDRYLRGLASYKFTGKLSNTYIGAGARWSQLSTTNYTKNGDFTNANAWHPELGVGHDFNYLMRGQILYMFESQHEVVTLPTGEICTSICDNKERGVDISVWFPSPSSEHHFMFRMNAVIFRYQDAPAAIVSRHTTDSTEFMLMYRF